MINRNILIILFFSLLACKSEPEFRLTIPKDKLQLVFKDMVLAGEAVDLYAPMNQDSVRELFTKQISEIHNISVAEITANMDMLKSNEAKFLEMCDSVALVLRNLDKNMTLGKKPKKESVKLNK